MERQILVIPFFLEVLRYLYLFIDSGIQSNKLYYLQMVNIVELSDPVDLTNESMGIKIYGAPHQCVRKNFTEKIHEPECFAGLREPSQINMEMDGIWKTLCHYAKSCERLGVYSFCITLEKIAGQNYELILPFLWRTK